MINEMSLVLPHDHSATPGMAGTDPGSQFAYVECVLPGPESSAKSTCVGTMFRGFAMHISMNHIC